MIPTEASADVRRIVARLVTVPHGDLLRLDDVSAALGRDVRTCRHLLYSAMRVVQREAGAVFALERGHGYRRLTADAAPGVVGSAARARIRSQARRARSAIRSAMRHANGVAPDAVRRADKETTALGLLEYIARDATVTTIVAADRPPPAPELTRRLLAAMAAR